jgi:rRNA-processing protein FCF1
MKLKVIADTSFLMIPGMFRVDVKKELERLIEREYELLIPKAVMMELERLSKEGAPKEKAAAEIGLQVAMGGTIVGGEKSADESIVELASERSCAVGTTDAALRRRLRKLGTTVVYLRQKSHLAVEGSAG